MGTLFDIIGSIFFTGILTITILTLNGNMVDSNINSIETYEVQIQSLQLSRIMEYDIYKAGYNVPIKANRITVADTSSLTFQADLQNNGTKNTIQYALGSANGESSNPRDLQLTRTIDGAQLFISYNVTRFYLTFYDSTNTKLATPLSAANLLKVRTIDVMLQLQTPDPVGYIQRTNPVRTDTLYTGAYYEKMMTAYNLAY